MGNTPSAAAIPLPLSGAAATALAAAPSEVAIALQPPAFATHSLVLIATDTGPTTYLVTSAEPLSSADAMLALSTDPHGCPASLDLLGSSVVVVSLRRVT
jgi:hypothetical protein